MKKLILIITILALFGINEAKSQQGYKAIYTVGGLTYKNGGNVMIGIDFPNNFYTSFEIFGLYYFRRSEKNYMAGLSYKPCLSRGINYMFRGKIAGAAGTTTHEFIFAPIVGFEYIYSLSPTVDFMWLTDGGYYHKTIERWRVNTYVGFRINF